MKAAKIISIFFIFILITGCSTSSVYQESRQDFNSRPGIGNLDPAIPLSDHLRRLPGVSVKGTGLNAKVRMPGLKTYWSDPEPLFVIDGRMIAGGYQSAMVSVDINDIESIKAIRNINDRAKYGMRGSNGVIEIFTKK